MIFIVIRGFYPEPNPDDSLHYQKKVPQELEEAVLTAMGWASQADVPPGETDLTQDQAIAILAALNDPIRADLMYSVGLFR